MLLRRKQQIGQVELVGAVAPYLSLPAELAGRRVIHFIDNTSALAALAKGYSGVPDSAHIVHVFHAWAAAASASVWFEYVRSKANIADLPSRFAIRELWRLFGEFGWKGVAEVVACVLPSLASFEPAYTARSVAEGASAAPRADTATQ